MYHALPGAQAARIGRLYGQDNHLSSSDGVR